MMTDKELKEFGNKVEKEAVDTAKANPKSTLIVGACIAVGVIGALVALYYLIF